ncbi:MAG: hypothetical protein ACFFD1_14490, partial [Candidatus Thorarchaeota archaeon]
YRSYQDSKKNQAYLWSKYGEETKRIAFKDVYLPLMEYLDLPIQETSENNSYRGRYNPIIWDISYDNVVDEFVAKFQQYLSKKSIQISEPTRYVIEKIQEVLKKYQDYWKPDIPYILDHSIDFPPKMTALITQLTIVGTEKTDLIRFLPIYLCFSINFGKNYEDESEFRLQDERAWLATVTRVPQYLEIINYYHDLLFSEWSNFWPYEMIEKDRLLEHLISSSKEKIYSDQIEMLYSNFKSRIDQGENMCYLFSPSPVNDNGFWVVLLAIKETILQKTKEYQDHRLSKFVYDLKNKNEEEYDLRNELFLKFIYLSMLKFFDPKIDFNSIKNICLSIENKEGKQEDKFTLPVEKNK